MSNQTVSEITNPVIPLTATLTYFASEYMLVTPSERALVKRIRSTKGRCIVEVDVVNGAPRSIEKIHEVAL